MHWGNYPLGNTLLHDSTTKIFTGWVRAWKKYAISWASSCRDTLRASHRVYPVAQDRFVILLACPWLSYMSCLSKWSSYHPHALGALSVRHFTTIFEHNKQINHCNVKSLLYVGRSLLDSYGGCSTVAQLTGWVVGGFYGNSLIHILEVTIDFAMSGVACLIIGGEQQHEVSVIKDLLTPVEQAAKQWRNVLWCNRTRKNGEERVLYIDAKGDAGLNACGVWKIRLGLSCLDGWSSCKHDALDGDGGVNDKMIGAKLLILPSPFQVLFPPGLFI